MTNASCLTAPFLQDKVYLRQEQVEKIATGLLVSKIAKIALKLDKVAKILKAETNSRFVSFKDTDFWFDRETGSIYTGDETSICFKAKSGGEVNANLATEIASGKVIANLKFSAMNQEEVHKVFASYVTTPCKQVEEQDLLIGHYDKEKAYYFKDRFRSFACKDDTNYNLIFVLVHRLAPQKVLPWDLATSAVTFLSLGLVPATLTGEKKTLYQQLATCFAQLRPYLQFQAAETELKITLATEAVVSAVKRGEITGSIMGETLDYASCKEQICTQPNAAVTAVIAKELLACDYERANLLPYPEEYLLDMQKGHWDLASSAPLTASDREVKLAQTFVARPAEVDVQREAVCGIDFGTRSTVVACRKKGDTLIRVGGTHEALPSRQDYENPTVLQIVDLPSFWQSYTQLAGRPYTRWEQLKASHAAANNLLAAESANRIKWDFLDELKQWAADSCAKMLVGEVWQSYAQLQEGDFDPLEIYAYYLGLNINNMLSKICLHYILSYPVSFTESTKQKIEASFKRGLQKSLPLAVQQQANFPKRFRVYMGASEPAAFALTALKEFNLYPTQRGTSLAYGVFDFGGGTTDFSFGTVEVSAREQEKYVLTPLGRGGDAHLGGELLLHGLAYLVYLGNLEVMHRSNIPFTLPYPYEEAPAGTEALVRKHNDSTRLALINSRLLAAKLRPYWEEEREFTLGESIAVELYNQEQKLVPLQLTVEENKLQEYLKEKITAGVTNFRQTCRVAFGLYSRVQFPIHIFLAGNSSHSSLVKKAFEQVLRNEEEYIGNVANAFVLHPLLEDRAENKQDFAHLRTSKTGVAFGLLECYRGSDNVRILPLQETHGLYCVGKMERRDDGKEYFKSIIRMDTDMGKWKTLRAVYGDEGQFELYFTTEARAVLEKLQREEVERIFCDFEPVEYSEKWRIFVRFVKPTVLEYVVGTEEERQNDSFSQEIQSVDLRSYED